MNLNDFKRGLANIVAMESGSGMTPTEMRLKGLCIHCGEEALPKCYSDAGEREYRISGFCERCFDECCPDD